MGPEAVIPLCYICMVLPDPDREDPETAIVGTLAIARVGGLRAVQSTLCEKHGDMVADATIKTALAIYAAKEGRVPS